MTYFLAFAGAGIAFLVLDLVWLGIVAQEFYNTQMGALKAPSFNIPAAIAFYVMYLVGVVIFAIAPGLEANSLMKTITYGAMLGFFCYGTYDLTNLAVMRDYPMRLALVDMAWGTVLTACASAAGYLAAKSLV